MGVAMNASAPSGPSNLYRHDDLARFVRAIFRAAGAPERDAALIADQLVEANLRGHNSHGVGMIPAYIRNALAGELAFDRPIEVVLDSGPILICDARQAPGQVSAHDALALAIPRAARDGCCLLGLRNSHHLGRIGHWAEQCAAAGLASVHFVNVVSEPIVAPFGGVRARVGTNPFCVGIPRHGEPPLVVDFATSKWAAGKVREAYHKGRPAPPGTLFDAAGKPTVDPSVLFDEPKGALRPMADHKGWGLAVACELLGAALIGGRTQTGPKSREAIINSMLSIVISPQTLGTADAFGAEMDAFLGWTRSEADAAILLPGEPETLSRQARERDGIPIDPTSWSAILDAAKLVGVDAAAVPIGWPLSPG